MTSKRSERLETLTKLRLSEEAERRATLASAHREQAVREEQLKEAREAIQAAEACLNSVLGEPALDLRGLQQARRNIEALHVLERDLRMRLRDTTHQVARCRRELQRARSARRAAEELHNRASSEERLLAGRAETRASDEASVLRWEGGAA